MKTEELHKENRNLKEKMAEMGLQLYNEMSSPILVFHFAEGNERKEKKTRRSEFFFFFLVTN